jgi:probable H4MPT-linked C1 transfer pathway protein
MSLAVLGLDIGGANLKAAHTDGTARTEPFALWKDPGGLPRALDALIRSMPAHGLLAVTMTGELCDCFETKRRGVNAILDAVESTARGTPLRVWQWTREARPAAAGRFVDVATARATALQTAAANWLALATFCGRFAPQGPALLIDIGSTTTDIVPLLDGRPVPLGLTDPERLRSRELVYTGVRRTPLCALLGGSAAAELFATTLDVHLVLGNLPEDAADCATADGRPATLSNAHARLARMLCADGETSEEQERIRLARRALSQQVHLIRSALEAACVNLPGAPKDLIVSGSGEFLVPAVLADIPDLRSTSVTAFAALAGSEVSRAACAYAVASLARAMDS